MLSFNLFIKRVIFAVLVFAVPWIVNVLMITLGDLLGDEEVNFTDCLENANSECINELESGFNKGTCDYGQTKSCYVCNTNDKLLRWTSKKPTYDSYNYACPAGWREIDKNEEDCGVKKCWQCNSHSNIYHWGITYPSSSDCPSGWHELNRDEDNCK